MTAHVGRLQAIIEDEPNSLPDPARALCQDLLEVITNLSTRISALDVAHIPGQVRQLISERNRAALVFALRGDDGSLQERTFKGIYCHIEAPASRMPELNAVPGLPRTRDRVAQ